MTKILQACSALLFSTSVWASEPAPLPADAVTPPVTTAPASSAVAVAPDASEPVAAVAAAAPLPPPAPEPYTGWGHGARAPMYANLMLSAGVLGEDGGNRLTTRDSQVLEGGGGLFRIGAVLGPHHRLGGRFQWFVRPTKKVALESGATASASTDWGAVTFGYAGPEYLYTSDLGLYVGGSVGVAGAASTRKVDTGSNDDPQTEKASAGIAGMVSAGYEWRASKWLALNAEVFGGLYHGVDDNEATMNGGLFGLAMGVGF
jgi:hypothetical protein